MANCKTDLTGRPYATVAEVKEGTILEADGGFECMDKGDKLKVISRPDGSLYIECLAFGGHSLDGQIDIDEDDGTKFYNGLYLAHDQPH